MHAVKRSIKTQYSVSQKIFHWLSALLIFGLLIAGFVMTAMPYSPAKLDIYALHKAFGLVVIILTGFRLITRFITGMPISPPTHKQWEKILAHLTHWSLYGLLFLMPLSGWVMSSAGDFPISFFGLNVPDITGKNEALFLKSRVVHEVLAFLIIGLAGLHIVGALKHHIIDKDQTLNMMAGRKNIIFSALFVLLFIGAAGFAVAELAKEFFEKPKVDNMALVETVNSMNVNPSVSKNPFTSTENLTDPASWSIIQEQSAIQFTASQYGSDFSGSFEQFFGDIIFDPDNLLKSRADIEIHISSIKTGSADRDAQAVSPEWFDADTYPSARFESERFEALEQAGHYKAYGHLTIKEETLPVAFPFSLTFDEQPNKLKTAVMKATLSLDRADYAVGTGQWAQDDAIGYMITLNLNIKAEQK